MSCSGDHHHFTARASACDCAGTTSTLATGGLPYPSWILDETSRFGTRHSNYALATDPGTGRTHLVREYLPDSVTDPIAQRRRFIAVAKSLRTAVPASQRLLYAYTRNIHCYIVADPPQGTPLFQLTLPGRTAEGDTFTRLGALLTALQQLHTAGAAAGPLFHANLRPETIWSIQGATHRGPDAPLELPHSLYLENILRENQLPPEHFQQQDLLAAADAALTLTQGFGTSADRSTRLQRIADPLLGATLEYLYGLHGTRPNTAKAALDYLKLLQNAASTHDPNLFGQARTLSPSPRLLRLANSPPPAPPPPPPRPPAPHPPAPHPQPAPAAPPPQQPPPFHPPPYVPVVPPPAPQPLAPQPAAPQPVKPQPRSGCGGCLLTLLLAVLVLGAVIALLVNRSTPTATTLDFSADPNPAPHKARVELHWTSSGFERLELDGKDVDLNGSLFLLASTSHLYTLTGIRPNGSRDVRTLELTVLAHRLNKPSPAISLVPSPEPASQTETAATPANSPDPISPSQPAELQAVNAALQQWAQAMLSNDPNREAANYAPQIDRYFLKSNVTQDFVRSYLTQVRNGGTTFTQFDLSDLLTVPEPDGSVEARFNKEVSYLTPIGPKHQTAHSVLHFRPVDGSWKITSERDFRGRAPAP